MGGQTACQEPYTRDAGGLLRRNRERAESGCAGDQDEEVAPPSFDDLVGALEQRLRHCQAERVGGHHVDDQLKLDRLLDR